MPEHNEHHLGFETFSDTLLPFLPKETGPGSDSGGGKTEKQSKEKDKEENERVFLI